MHLTDGGTRQISADQIFLNVGARPSAPHIDGLDMISTLNSTSIMELDQVPDHLMIIGGGYIGLEFGQMFRRFGSKVTIIQRGARLLAREDADVADEVAKILREDGIDVLLETDTVRAASANGGVQLTVKNAQGERTLSGSHVLVAAGRTSNADRLNLAAAGIQTDKAGFITVNDKLETNVSGIYCLGDAKGVPAFTHISYDDFRIVRTNFIEGGSASIHNRIVPYTVFIDPQLGRVGLGEEEARAQGLNIRVAKLPMTSVARAEETAETRGFMKAVLDAQSGQILGCAILGIDGGEVMAVIQVAMMGKLPYTVLRDTAFAHPTVAELLNNLFMTLDS